MPSLRKCLLLGTAAAFTLALPFLALALPAGVAINEIRIDQPGTDNDEYFELISAPGSSLNGYTYLVIGDGVGDCGVIEAVVDLSGQVVPASGLFVAAEATFTLGTADMTTSLNFENGDNVTHMLVYGFSGANGDDLDTNDDGVLDVTPWLGIEDDVALILGLTPDCVSADSYYSSNTVGPDGTFVPGHVFRCGSSWEIGQFDPAGGLDTPGAANSNCPVPVENSTWGKIKSQYRTIED